MALWNQVLSGFDAEDETVNFGARAVAESYDSVYETRTLATIQANGEVIENPKIVGSVHDSTLCVTIDKSITIFADKLCQEIKLCIGFDSPITSHCISNDCYFVFVTLTNGILYCLNLEAGGSLVFSQNVTRSYEESGEKIIKIFFEDVGHDGSDLLLVSSKGDIHKVSGFTAEVMESVIDEVDIEKLEELTQDIQCTLLFKENHKREVASAEVNLQSKERLVVMIGKNICTWPNQQLCTLNSLPYEYAKVQYFRNNRFLLCLRTDGALNILCSITLIAKKVWDGPASDIIIIEDEPDASPQILIVLKPKEGSSTTSIQLVSYPDFKVKFNLLVPTTTYLVNPDGGSTIDDIIFLEGASTTSAAIDTVKVKAIEENLPECRLQRLLRRGKWGEAEIFANRFHLNTETIYCSKAASLTREFNSPENDLSMEEKLNQLIDTLDKIKDVEFVFQLCHNIITTDIEETRRLVCYAHERLIKDAGTINDELKAMHLSSLNNTLLRIETYELICGTRDLDDSYSREDIRSWTRFSKADLLSECKTYLSHGELNVAALIWVRHSATLLSNMTNVMVREMLQIIPADILQQDLSPWLFYVVPSFLSVCPDGLPEIVTWSYTRVKSFEKIDRTHWPENGLDFCKKLIEFINFEETQSFFHLQQQYSTLDSPLQQLTTVIQALTDLQYLKTKYRLIIGIEAYMGEPIEVAHLLLHKIYPQGVSDFIQDFLHRYLLNHSLKNDHILILYIQKTLKKSEGWWFWTEAPWEQKIASIIGCIHNVKCRLQQTLETLKKASVPWSAAIQALVETSISSKHSLVSAIITERNSVATKLLLKKYGFEHLGVSKTLIRYIIKQNRDEMLDDLYELTKSNRHLRTEALSICVNFFLNKGDLERMITVIKNQPDKDAIYCCKEIINYIIVCLGLKEINSTADYYAEVIGMMLIELKRIFLPGSDAGRSICDVDDILATASELKSVCLLRKEFGIILTQSEYQTKNEIVLRENLEKLCNEIIDNERLSAWTLYKRAGRMADLLGLPRILAVCFLLENTGETEILKYYIQGIKETGSFSAKESLYVKRLCEIYIFELKKGDPTAFSGLKNLSAAALDSCSIGEISQILLTTVWTHLNYKITESDETIDGTIVRTGITHKNKWKLHNIYIDPAMCSSYSILPFFIKSFKFHLSSQDKAKFKGDVTSTEENCSEQLADLMAILKAIKNESYDFPVLQILNTLAPLCSLGTQSEQIIPVINSVKEKCLRTLLQKIVSARAFDLQFGISCLTMLSEQDALKWLTSACKMYQTDYSRLKAISDLGWEYCNSIENTNHLQYFRYYRVCHYWARKLSNYGVHHKDITMSNTEGKQEILERLMRSKNSGLIDLIKEFCTDFEFDFDECYILYLDILLKQWNPEIEIITLNNEKELKIDKNDITALQKTCRELVALTENKSAIRKHLAALWSKINFYHYEVFLIIMELLEDKNETRLNHFCFLQNYVRFGSPMHIEYEEWSQLCPENNSLPEISKWRLPYLPKVDQWKLIEPELNLSTYEKWMQVAQILDLQIHLICTFAIKGSVDQVWGTDFGLKERNSNEWLIHPKNSTLLEDIKTCIKYMPDQDALYYGTALLYYVVNHTPSGADQAAAAQECYAYAQKWGQASVQADGTMIEKIRYKYLQLTAKHILHTHGLGNENYVQLCVFPERLVRELYMDKTIVLRSRGATEKRPDINSAVDLLGKIFSLNLIQLRLELLDEWLQSSSDFNSKLDESITYDIAAVTSLSENNSIDDDNLLRACYILECGDKILSANYLINIGFGVKNETSSFRPGIQFRALRVLLFITDSATVQDLTKRDLQSIKRYMKSLQYVSGLERLGLAFNVQRFESSSKVELAQALSRNHAHLPQALILILQMCIDFEIKNYTLWDETLSAMAKVGMVKELGSFLPKVSTASHVIGCDGYIKGWEVLIWEPFRKTNARLSQEQLDECLTSICSLHSCPVARKLNLKPIITISFRSDRPELAAALLPFLNKNDSDFVLEAMSSSYEILEVIEDLRALATRQFLTISYSVRILEELLKSNAAEDG